MSKKVREEDSAKNFAKNRASNVINNTMTKNNRSQQNIKQNNQWFDEYKKQSQTSQRTFDTKATQRSQQAAEAYKMLKTEFDRNKKKKNSSSGGHGF